MHKLFMYVSAYVCRYVALEKNYLTGVKHGVSRLVYHHSITFGQKPTKPCTQRFKLETKL